MRRCHMCVYLSLTLVTAVIHFAKLFYIGGFSRQILQAVLSQQSFESRLHSLVTCHVLVFFFFFEKPVIYNVFLF